MGLPTLRDIIAALAKHGCDPRVDEPGPIFRTDVLSLEDLRPGMALRKIRDVKRQRAYTYKQ